MITVANNSINYNDKRFTEVTAEKNAALKESEKTYDQMITDSDKYYQAQIDASKEYADKQTQLQQEQTDFAIEKIEQQKDQAHQDYLKEQSASYVDYQKQSNQYGTNAEKQAEMGLAHTGYSESSQVGMWNTYQNRYATAREVYNRAVLNYDNAITEARLQNNSVLAEIAYNSLQQQLQLSLQGFQYKNQLILDKANKKAEIEDRYHARWQDVLQQINTENSLAEQIRQYNESLAFQKEQFAWQKSQASGGGSSGGSSGGSKGSAKNTKSKTGSSSSSKNTKNSKGSSLDMGSVIGLGYGPISADTVSELVATGKVKATEKNGTITVKNANGKKPTQKERNAVVNGKNNASKYLSWWSK